jgi:hypothetical protein
MNKGNFQAYNFLRNKQKEISGKMFCPGCGMEEFQSNQFCRACGTDLRNIRFALEKPDTITESAVSARDEIGRAVAAKIHEMNSAKDLKKFTEEVLPEIEKFLESPAEKRMRRIRTGTLLSSVGAGAAIAFTFVSGFMKDSDIIIIAALGVVCFFIGLSFVINGLLFTVPKKSLTDKSTDAESQREIDANTSELVLPEARQIFTSVTEETTRHLNKKNPTK